MFLKLEFYLGYLKYSLVDFKIYLASTFVKKLFLLLMTLNFK
ncbi:hypothetical protein SAMN05421540_11320 [Psychroflexus halocasei]|uniref:Uncharacterized protein n=1 Tax=Psychroflexus halocasei TaxID=908615 RepID=A0A1H4DPX3_9FLAO|nr:hypothetical protein SAMN05421540_11320 [Psychroflexus halocasei]